MKDWEALKPAVFMVAILGVALLLIAAAIQTGHDSWIIPSPEKTAEGFVSALAAHRYTGARDALSEETKNQVDESDLQQLVKDIESTSFKGIQDAHEVDSRKQGDTATATVQVKFGNNNEQDVRFPLKREKGVWKVTSIDPLHALAGK